jgi:sRNA-binding carbon storage regulator CsrA
MQRRDRLNAEDSHMGINWPLNLHIHRKMQNDQVKADKSAPNVGSK